MAISKGLKVFVLDDSTLEQRSIKEFLEEYVFTKGDDSTILVSQSLEDAKKQLGKLKNSIDLFILDGQLNPDFGYDLIPTIKKTNKLAKIAMCSGNSDLNRKGVEKGADMEIAKRELGSVTGSKKAQEGYAEELNELLKLK